EGQSVLNMWIDCVVTGIEASKLILQNCQFIRPFVPETVDGRAWESWDTAEIATDLRFFHFVPGERWHAFEGYAEHQYFIDPCKLLLTRSEEHTSELQSRENLVCRLLLEK